MKIGEVAKRVGVDVHVLRHWHDMGVVVPDRAESGHRIYTEEHIRRLRIVQSCQSVGMSLAEIRLVLHRDEEGRAEIIDLRLRWIRLQRAQLEDAEKFLEHVIGCTHDFLTRCSDCTKYASKDWSANHQAGRADSLMTNNS
ncbi:MAG TPA: MerR family transcriptional regulator [Candidatus Agrococcus pullicola]|uniref:MerR family transcriptional regulator n=1 Tax=Candidatus Agrococcus pullicola TaxID=2838429 RepID=A0A9D1YXV7_9MICO|nr:MerR family transcriptional regulator [Candidatus Agrococcus pullicola]